MIDQTWFLAFIFTPALIVLGGYVALRLFERDMKRRHPRPGE